MIEQEISWKAKGIYIATALTIVLLTPLVHWIGQKIVQALKLLPNNIPKVIQNILSQIPLFLLLLGAIWLAVYFSSITPSNKVYFTKDTYIEYDEETKRLKVFKNGSRVADF